MPRRNPSLSGIGKTVGVVTSFTGRHAYLAAAYPFWIRMDDQVYPSVEHAYLASLFESDSDRGAILSRKRPESARRMAAALRSRMQHPSFGRRESVMEALNRQKFDSDEALRTGLVLTGIVPLLNGQPTDSADLFWGCARTPDGLWAGENRLGRILMRLRAEYRLGIDDTPDLHRLDIKPSDVVE